MKTTLYLLRHGAAEGNLAKPPRLLGRNDDPPLAKIGVRQAEVTRDFLAVRAIDVCYCSPLRRAVQTAKILAEPHEISPRPLPALIECDLGRWENRDWPSIRAAEPEAYERFMSNPMRHGYPDGESFGDVHRRVAPVFEDILSKHAGLGVLVVSHHVVNRVYLANLLGLPPELVRRVSLDNCGISIVIHEDGRTRVSSLNAVLHLQGVAA